MTEHADPVTDFRAAVKNLRTLPLPQRERAFCRLLEQFAAARLAEAQDNGDIRSYVAALDAAWKAAFEISVLDRPPPSVRH